jgi:hypothetical protein
MEWLDPRDGRDLARLDEDTRLAPASAHIAHPRGILATA